MIKENPDLRTLLMTDLETRDDIDERHYLGKITKEERQIEINTWREELQKKIKGILNNQGNE